MSSATPVLEPTSSTTEISVMVGFSGPSRSLTAESAMRAFRELS
jgi:hypothetical protein